MKHYGHTIKTSSAQAAHVKSVHTAIIDSWYGGTTPSNVPYEIGIADDQIAIYAETAQDSYYAFVHVQSIVDAHDPFDLLWSRLKASIVDARTNGGKVITKTDNTDVHVALFEHDVMRVTLVRADAVMRMKLTDQDALKVAAQILANVDTDKLNEE
jgi:hypothetical protein